MIGKRLSTARPEKGISERRAKMKQPVKESRFTTLIKRMNFE
jgi:hypothetical protein